MSIKIHSILLLDFRKYPMFLCVETLTWEIVHLLFQKQENWTMFDASESQKTGT